MSKTKTAVLAGTVCRSSWLHFLRGITRYEGDARLINGTMIENQSHTRALYRWEQEGASPLWWKVDQFLCPYDLTWTDFEIYCFVESINLWEDCPPKDWEEMS